MLSSESTASFGRQQPDCRSVRCHCWLAERFHWRFRLHFLAQPWYLPGLWHRIGLRSLSAYLESSKEIKSHTFLSRAISYLESSTSAISSVGARIELLIAAPLQRSPDVHKGVILDLELAIGDSRIHNRGGSDTAQCSSKGLEVASSLTALWRRDGRTENCGEEGGDDNRGLHFG
jgi:hypothetical protein